MTAPDSIVWLEDVGVGSWIPAEQLPEHGVVGSLVPPRFDSYVGVRLVGEHATVVDPDGALRDHLVASLRVRRLSTERCTFALADLYGWDGHAAARHADLVDVDQMAAEASVDDLMADLHRRAAETPPQPPATPQMPSLLETSIRSYLLYAGSVEDADAIARAGAPVAMPDLWWPEDRSWFVATDTDLDFVVVAGRDDLTGSLAREGVYVESLTERSWLV